MNQGFKVDVENLCAILENEFVDLARMPFLDETEVPIGDHKGFRISILITRKDEEDDEIKEEFVCVTAG